MKTLIIGLFALAIVVTGATRVSADLDSSRLLLYWPCDEGSGDVLTDASGNGFNGEILDLDGGNHIWEDGQYGTAIRLQAAYGVAQGDIVNTTGDTGEATLGCWLKLNAHSTYNGIITVEDPDGGDPACCEFRIMVDPAASPFWNAGHHVDQNLDDVFTFELDTWYHYVLVADGVTSKIYMDGALVGEAVEDFPLPTDLADSIVYLGTGEAPGTWTVEDSVVDEVMIWDKALSEDEVVDMMLGDVSAVSYNGKLATTWANVKKQ